MKIFSFKKLKVFKKTLAFLKSIVIIINIKTENRSSTLEKHRVES